MNSRQIFTLLHSTIPKQFYGVFPSDQLPSKVAVFPACFVNNTDPSGKPGSHWVAIYIDSNKRGEYFDSYGRPPEILAIKSFLNEYSECWGYNEKRLQGLFSSVCGHYCIYFILQRAFGTPMSSFLDKFSSEEYEENDHLITEWLNENFELDTDAYNIDFIVNQVCHALFNNVE
jgi:hypothetical protein